jgi:hypothetical protein
MKSIEKNILKSFNLAKSDIIQLQNKVIDLSRNQKVLVERLEKLNQPVKKTVTKKSKTFVAAKEGKKFHIKECPFAKNIKPKSKLTFKSKNTALNKGYKPCNCVK